MRVFHLVFVRNIINLNIRGDRFLIKKNVPCNAQQVICGAGSKWSPLYKLLFNDVILYYRVFYSKRKINDEIAPLINFWMYMALSKKFNINDFAKYITIFYQIKNSPPLCLYCVLSSVAVVPWEQDKYILKLWYWGREGELIYSIYVVYIRINIYCQNVRYKLFYNFPKEEH